MFVYWNEITQARSPGSYRMLVMIEYFELDPIRPAIASLGASGEVFHIWTQWASAGGVCGRLERGEVAAPAAACDEEFPVHAAATPQMSSAARRVARRSNRPRRSSLLPIT